jgi:hypothetical protein
VVMLYTCVREILSRHLGRATDYHDVTVTVVYSVPPSKH